MSAPTDAGPCRGPAAGSPPAIAVRERWADRDYASEYDRLARYVAESQASVPVAAAVNAVVDDPTEADRRRARRFYREFADLFRVFEPTSMVAVPVAESDDPAKKYDYENRETEPDLVWVEARPALVDARSPLIASIRNSNIADSPPSHDDRPRERAASVLSSVGRLTSDAQRALLLRYLADHKRLHGRARGTADADAGRSVRTDGGTVRVGDRFTSPAKAAETAERVDETGRGLWAVAAEDDAVEALTHVSLTLAREVVDSPVASVAALGDAIETLHDSRWRQPRQDDSRNRPGEVPPHVVIVEAHSDLVAHAHVLYAGRPQPEADLKAEWADMTDSPPWKPPQVSVETVPVDDDAAVERVVGYLGETARDCRRLAALSAERLEGHADDLVAGTAPDEVRRLARLALPFATEARHVRATPGLRDAAEDAPRESESLARPSSSGLSRPRPGRAGADPVVDSRPVAWRRVGGRPRRRPPSRPRPRHRRGPHAVDRPPPGHERSYGITNEDNP